LNKLFLILMKLFEKNIQIFQIWLAYNYYYQIHKKTNYYLKLRIKWAKNLTITVNKYEGKTLESFYLNIRELYFQ